jgi:hypothetical protein
MLGNGSCCNCYFVDFESNIHPKNLKDILQNLTFLMTTVCVQEHEMGVVVRRYRIMRYINTAVTIFREFKEQQY